MKDKSKSCHLPKQHIAGDINLPPNKTEVAFFSLGSNLPLPETGMGVSASATGCITLALGVGGDPKGPLLSVWNPLLHHPHLFSSYKTSSFSSSWSQLQCHLLRDTLPDHLHCVPSLILLVSSQNKQITMCNDVMHPSLLMTSPKRA